ncbi:RNA polymerase II elongation factor Ell-like [Bactrocera dorsalis]|uniref:RNA polymerase II elongation factor Ell-like n=1 Tax=Bactrocera dorsalis TaxID=27457 RepID=A0ABM3J1D1_BACDO|nr:RNA polymerase II elongation factor Ell-like [Bactrocera dorsalis]
MASNISSNCYSGHKIDRYSDNRHRSTDEKENTSKSQNSTDVSRCSIRERLIHLLALKPFTKLELTSRLQKEGIRNHERSSINSILMAIAQLRNQMYHLRVHMWYYVNENWPFYTEEEQNQVKRNKPKDPTPSDNSTKEEQNQVKRNKPRDPTPSDNSTVGSSCEVSNSANTSGLSCCHIRERLIHLLALKPFSKVELFSRLRKEGIRDDDRSSIKSILMDIASVRNNVYSLRGHMWENVNENWPFYTEDEQNQVKRNKPQDLSPPHNSNDSSSCGSLSPSSSPPQQIDSLEYEYLPPAKKQRISRVSPNSKHDVASSNRIGNKTDNSTTQFSSHSTKKDSAYQNNLYTYDSDNTNRVLVSSNSSNITINNPTHCNNHWTKNDSKNQEKDISRNNGDQLNLKNDGNSKPESDLPKKNGSLTDSAAPATRKSYTLIDMFGDDTANPTKRTTKDGSHKRKATTSDLQQQTQPQRNLTERLVDLFGDDIATPPKQTANDRPLKRKKETDHNLHQQQPQRNSPEMTESLAEPVAPAPRKEYKLIDLFGDDIATPTKVTTNDREKRHKKESSDQNLRPQSHLSKKSETLTKSKKQRMIELFGEDSD